MTYFSLWLNWIKTKNLHCGYIRQCLPDGSKRSSEDLRFCSLSLIGRQLRNPAECRSSSRQRLLGIWECFRWFDQVRILGCGCHRGTSVHMRISARFYTGHREPDSWGLWCRIWIYPFWRIFPCKFRQRLADLRSDSRPVSGSVRIRNILYCSAHGSSKSHPAGQSSALRLSRCWKFGTNITKWKSKYLFCDDLLTILRFSRRKFSRGHRIIASLLYRYFYNNFNNRFLEYILTVLNARFEGKRRVR